MSFSLSPSSLSLMRECERCFWLDKHGYWKRPTGIVMSLPNGMDRVIKHHFDRYLDLDVLPPELAKTECNGAMKLFNDREKLAEWRNNFKGIRYTDASGNSVHGAIDTLLRSGNKLVVLDFKTRGFPLKEDTPQHYQHQLNIYNFLFRKNGYETEDFSYLLFYIPKEIQETGELIFTTQLVRLTTSILDAEELLQRAFYVLAGNCPTRGCHWCGRIEPVR